MQKAVIIHLWMPVARHLLRPTRKLGRATLKRFPIWSCTGWGLPSFPGHPGNWCALTAPFHPYPALIGEAVCFLLHLPSRRRDSTLWSTLPCGVRTFLRRSKRRRSPGLLRPKLLPEFCTPRFYILAQAAPLSGALPGINDTLAIGADLDLVQSQQLVEGLGWNVHVADLADCVFNRSHCHPAPVLLDSSISLI